MRQKTTCPHCKTRFDAPNEAFNSVGKCPACGNVNDPTKSLVQSAWEVRKSPALETRIADANKNTTFMKFTAGAASPTRGIKFVSGVLVIGVLILIWWFSRTPNLSNTLLTDGESMSFFSFCFWNSITWLIGSVAGAFLLLAPIIAAVFCIPFTFRLKRMGILRTIRPIFRYVFVLVVYPALFWAITKGVRAWLPHHMVGYWIGIALISPGLSKCGANEINMKEYFRVNAAQLDPAALVGSQIYESKNYGA